MILNAALTSSSVGGGSFILSAGNNVTIGAAITASGGSVMLSAGNNGTGPGVAGGTVNFAAGAVTAANFAVHFNPVNYTTTSAEIAAYRAKATLTGTYDARAWAFINNASATAQNKTYDGTTNATLNTPFTLLAGPDGSTQGQIVSLVAGASNFNSKDVTTANTVSFTGYGLAGSDVGSYALFSQPANQAAQITPASVTITGMAANNKVYDGTLLATLSNVGSVATGIVGEALVLNGPLAGNLQFNDPNVLLANSVTGTGYSLADGVGGLASNYALTATTSTAAAQITPASLAITADAQGKVYGTAEPALTYTTGAFQFGDTAASVLSGALSRAVGENVGSYVISQNSLASNANYTVAYTGNNLSITPAALNVVANPQSKLFGASDPALTFIVTGLVNNPALGIADTASTVLSGVLSRTPGESVLGGPYTINQGSLMVNSNYTLGFTQNSLIITGGVVAAPVLGFDPGQIIFAGIINNDYYHRPGNFWHISLNYNNADLGFDVMRGTNDSNSRLNRSVEGCNSVSGGGPCETWAFPQQREKDDEK